MYSTYKNLRDCERLNANPREFEVVFLEEEDALYQYVDKKWQPFVESKATVQGIDTNITLYELNQQIMTNKAPLEAEELTTQLNQIDILCDLTHNMFYMLYGKEINYFTLAMKTALPDMPTLKTLIAECLQNIGAVLDISLIGDNTDPSVEIWVKPYEADRATCLYLFPYDRGVEVFGG